MEVIQNNISQVKMLVEKYGVNQRRKKLLGEILQALEQGTGDELLHQIYLYGSMLKAQDLMERQFFLWLLELAENQSEK